MADPLSISASIIAIIQITSTIIGYLSDLKDALEDRKQLLNEVVNVHCLVNILQVHAQQPGTVISIGENVEKAEWKSGWLETLQILDRPGGPFEEIHCALKRLQSKLVPAQGRKKVAEIMQLLKWPFDKDEVTAVLATIERQKSILSLAVQNDHTGILRTISKGVQSMKTDVGAIRQGVAGLSIQQAHSAMRLQECQHQEIVSWLSPDLNFWARQQKIYGSHTEGTSEWLLENPEFIRWINGEQKRLWCTGHPGVGKSMLASVVINHLEKSNSAAEVGLAYVYCNYKDTGQTGTSLIGSLVQHLTALRSSVPADVIHTYQTHKLKGTRPNMPDFSNLLQSATKSFSTVYMIIDALDECNERERHQLLAELGKLPDSTRIMVTSRPIPNLASELLPCTQLEILARPEDIRSYVIHQISTSQSLSKFVKADPGLQDEILDVLVQKAAGMFLIPTLHMKVLAEIGTRKKVRQALKTLPEELDAVYDDILQRIDGQIPEQAKLARRVLMWMVYAKRSLTMIELQCAVTFETNDMPLDENDLYGPESLVAACCGLVTLEETTNIVRFTHYTVQEHFDRGRSKIFPDAETEIAEVCLAYLLNASLDDQEQVAAQRVNPFAMNWRSLRRDTLTAAKNLFERHRFLLFALTYWDSYMRGQPEIVCTTKLLRLFEQTEKLRSLKVLLRLYTGSYSHASRLPPPKALLLQCAAEYRLWKFIRVMVMTTQCEESDIQKALVAAASQSNTETVKFLLDYGTDVECSLLDNERPLSAAASSWDPGAEATMRLLISHGANINARHELVTPLYSDVTPLYSALHGRTEVLKLLLEHGADPDIKRDFDKLAFTLCNMFCLPMGAAALQLLIDYGADIHVMDERFGNLLMVAVSNSFSGRTPQRVELLLRYGMDINAQDSSGHTALDVAVCGVHVEAVITLLEHGATFDLDRTIHMLEQMKHISRSPSEPRNTCKPWLSPVSKHDIYNQNAIVEFLRRHQAKQVATKQPHALTAANLPLGASGDDTGDVSSPTPQDAPEPASTQHTTS